MAWEGAGVWGCCGGGGSGVVASASGAPALPAAVGRGKPRFGERLPDPSCLHLVYLASAKRLQVFPVPGGGEVSAAGMALAASLDGSQEPTLTPACPQPARGHLGPRSLKPSTEALCPWCLGCAPAQLMEGAHPGLSIHQSASLTAGNFPGTLCSSSRDEQVPWWW